MPISTSISLWRFAGGSLLSISPPRATPAWKAEVLERAAVAGRILISHDRRTMIHHFRDFLVSGKSSPGLLIVSQRAPVGAVAEAIVLLWAVAEPSELRNQAYHLPSLIRR